MYKLITITIDEMSAEVKATLDDNGRRIDARQAAMEIIASYPEEHLPAVFIFLSDLTAEMAAMSDDPAALSSDLTAKIDLYESQFQLIRRGAVPFRLGPLAKEMKS